MKRSFGVLPLPLLVLLALCLPAMLWAGDNGQPAEPYYDPPIINKLRCHSDPPATPCAPPARWVCDYFAPPDGGRGPETRWACRTPTRG